MAQRTLQAIRQIFYATLTDPVIVYSVNGGSPITLAASNVSARPISSIAPGNDVQPPSPLISFTVGSSGNIARLNERKIKVKVWVSSTVDDDDVTELYEQGVRARLHMADTAGMNGAPGAPLDISRPTSGGNTLGAAVRSCLETFVQPAEFDRDTARWYLYAEYLINAY